MYLPLIKNEEKCAGQLSYGFNIQDKFCKFSDFFLKGTSFVKLTHPSLFWARLRTAILTGIWIFWIGLSQRASVTVINQLVWTYQAYANVARKIVQMINIFGTNIKDKIFNQIRIKMENSNYKGGRNTIVSTQKIV